jgi:ABC-type transporter Mla subunit MlaD
MFATLQAILRHVQGLVGGVNLVARTLTDYHSSLHNTLLHIQQTQEKIMAELDDLKASVANLTTAVSDGTAEISALVAKVLALLGAPTGMDPAAVEQAAHDIQAQADAMNAAVAGAKGQVPA